MRVGKSFLKIIFDYLIPTVSWHSIHSKRKLVFSTFIFLFEHFSRMSMSWVIGINIHAYFPLIEQNARLEYIIQKVGRV